MAETTIATLTAQLSDNAALDITFVIDATGSMSSYIHAAQQTIKKVVNDLVSTEQADVRFALISYRDHPPQETSYVVNTSEFTNDITEMRANLDAISASGGGDTPEAVVDGLAAAGRLQWREKATKVCLLIADAPPHGLEAHGDSFANGCPCGLDPIVVCRSLAEMGITLYVLGCEPSITPYKSFFMTLANITGGQYCPLGNAQALSAVVVGGCREEIALERLMQEVTTDLSTTAAHLNDEEQAKYVHTKMLEKNVRAAKLQRADGAMPLITPEAIAWSKKARTLAEVREEFRPAPAENMPFTARSSSRVARTRSSVAADCVASPYYTAEDALSMEQCSRMVSKSKARTPMPSK